MFRKIHKKSEAGIGLKKKYGEGIIKENLQVYALMLPLFRIMYRVHLLSEKMWTGWA